MHPWCGVAEAGLVFEGVEFCCVWKMSSEFLKDIDCLGWISCRDLE